MAHKINQFILLICFLPALAGCFNTTVDTRPIKNPDDQRAEKPSVAVIHEETAALRANEINTSHWIHLNKPARIPILMYHSISKGNNSLHVPEQEFQAEMKWIKDHGYVTLTPVEAYLVLTRDIKPGKKCVLITLDDGYRDSYHTAYPIFRATCDHFYDREKSRRAQPSDDLGDDGDDETWDIDPKPYHQSSGSYPASPRPAESGNGSVKSTV